MSSDLYGLDAGNNTDIQRFVDSIEPATCLKKLPPRSLVMCHFTDDTSIPITCSRSHTMTPASRKPGTKHNGSVHGVNSDTNGPDLHANLKNSFGR